MAIHPDTLRIAAELIERFEGIKSNAYLDPVGIPTICAGITRYPGGKAVAMGDTCSMEVCRAHLMALLVGEYLPALQLIPGFSQLGAKRQAVLLSFAWNLGPHFYGGKGFESITRLLKDGATNPLVYQQMPQVLGLYVKAGGITLEGLVRRRQLEAGIWMEEQDSMGKFVATADTFLKKAPIDAKYLSELGKVAKTRNQVMTVTRVEEIPRDGHQWWTLPDGARWCVYGPHWQPAGAANPKPPAKEVDWSSMDAMINECLSVGEVLQYDIRRRPRAGSKEEAQILRIANEFLLLRRAWGAPIGVTSGYRPEPINSQVGGSPNSRHVVGDALDIYPIGGDINEFYLWLKHRWSGGLGDGRRKGFIHIDGRGGGHFNARGNTKPVVSWDY